eukprot:2442002-Amphidinium_carterae.1
MLPFATQPYKHAADTWPTITRGLYMVHATLMPMLLYSAGPRSNTAVCTIASKDNVATKGSKIVSSSGKNGSTRKPGKETRGNELTT